MLSVQFIFNFLWQTVDTDSKFNGVVRVSVINIVWSIEKEQLHIMSSENATRWTDKQQIHKA